VSRHVVVLALLGALAAPGRAQEVVLGGWALPEGAVVTSVGRLDSEMAAYVEGQDEPAFEVASHARDSIHTTVGVVTDGRLMEAEQLVARFVRADEVSVGGAVAGREEHRPLEGKTVRFVRDGERWARTLVGAEPTPEEAARLADHATLDDVEYPLRPVRVGEAWEVDSTAIAALYGDLAPGHTPHLTVRLDSLGTYEGGPAAFLSQDVEVVVRHAGGALVGLAMHARIVRRLDWRVDVLTAWEGPAWAEMATPDGPLVMEGRMRRGERQEVERP
jgi:hypothetical protein